VEIVAGQDEMRPPLAMDLLTQPEISHLPHVEPTRQFRVDFQLQLAFLLRVRSLNPLRLLRLIQQLRRELTALSFRILTRLLRLLICSTNTE